MKTLSGILLVLIVLASMFSDRFTDWYIAACGWLLGSILFVSLIVYGLSLVFGGA